MKQRSKYLVELGFDLRARQLESLHLGHFFLPGAVTHRRSGGRILSTYTQIEIGDRIGFRIYDATPLSSASNDFTLRRLTLEFESAREPVDLFPPIAGRLDARKFEKKERASLLYPALGVTGCFEAWFGKKRFLEITHPGLFKATYKLVVDIRGGDSRCCVHDPEWIIDEDGAHGWRADDRR